MILGIFHYHDSSDFNIIECRQNHKWSEFGTRRLGGADFTIIYVGF